MICGWLLPNRKPNHFKNTPQNYQFNAIFVSERGEVISTDAVRNLLSRLAVQTGLDLKVYYHMMRHTCGYYLVNQGYSIREIQDFLAYQDIKHTEQYTKLNARRFWNFDWYDL